MISWGRIMSAFIPEEDSINRIFRLLINSLRYQVLTKSPQKAPKFAIRYWFEYISGTRTLKFLNDFNDHNSRNLRFFGSLYALSGIILNQFSIGCFNRIPSKIADVWHYPYSGATTLIPSPEAQALMSCFPSALAIRSGN